MGKKRQNKKKSKKGHHKGPCQKQEVLDELIALEAVFADDFTLHQDSMGFDLHVVPYPSKVEVNHVSITLRVRYGDGYPHKPPGLDILDSQGEGNTDLLEQLNQLALELTKTQDVFMFSVIDLCQETLLSWNADIAAQQPQVTALAGCSEGLKSPR